MSTSELFKDFKYEALEAIQQMNADLLALELSPQDMESINSLFRSAHNLKGSSAMMGFVTLSEVARQLEDILELFRNRQLAVTSPRVDLLFEAFDLLSEIVNGLGDGGENLTATLKDRLALNSAKLRRLAEESKQKQLTLPEGGQSLLLQLRQELVSLDFQVWEAIRDDLSLQEQSLEGIIGEIHGKRAGPATLESLRRALHTIGGAASAAGLNSIFDLVDRLRTSIKKKDFSVQFVHNLNLLVEASRIVIRHEFRKAEVVTAEKEGPDISLLKAYKEELDKIEQDILESIAKEYKTLLPAIRLPLDQKVLSEPDRSSLKKALRTVKGTGGMLGISALWGLAQQLEEKVPSYAEADFLSQLDQLVRFLDYFIDPVKLTQALALSGQKPAGPVKEAEIPPILLFEEEEPSPAPIPVTVVPTVIQPEPVLSEEESFRKAFQDQKDQIPPEMREEFLQEFSGYYRDLNELEKKSHEATLTAADYSELRRIAHTIKGSSAMLGLTLLSQPALRVEQSIDSGQSFAEYQEDLQTLLKVLGLLFEEKAEKAEAATAKEEPQPLTDLFVEEEGAAPPIIQKAPLPPSPELEEEIESLFVEEAAPSIPAIPSEIFERREEAEKIQIKLTPARRVALVPEKMAPFKEAPAGRLEDKLIRVDLTRLDVLLNLVGELVTFRSGMEEKLKEEQQAVEELSTSTNRLLRLGATLENQYQLLTASGVTPSRYATEFDTLEFDRYTAFYQWSREISETAADTLTFQKKMSTEIKTTTELLERFGGILRELQDRTLKTRMVPLSSITSKLPRAVRDMAKTQGKDIRVVVEGEDLEIDKSLANQLDEPLIHLVRNSVDHGIESVEERRKKGKPEQGIIAIKAYRSGDSFILELSDDGGGINLEKIKAAAAQRGVTEVHRLANEDLLKIIFMPGFSTAPSVGELSGRGVGLDVVREHIEALRGTLQLSTIPGKGTTFSLSMPLTLSIVKALILQQGKELYAIPSSYVIQTLLVRPSQMIQEGEKFFISVKEERIPVYYFRDFIRGIPQASSAESEHLNGVLLNIGTDKYFLIVDRFVGQQEILIKPIGSPLDHVPGIAGASITVSGKVFLVLEIEQVMDSLELGRMAEEEREIVFGVPGVKEVPTLLIVDDSLSIRSIVSRTLEKAGYHVLTAKDGAEAMQVLKEEKVDGLILDVEMPKMSGFEVLSAMRAAPEYREIPVAMLTSRAGEKHRNKALSLGANDYITKPYKEDEFLRIVAKLVSRS